MSDIAETGYEIGQGNFQIMGLDIHSPAFLISNIVILGSVIFVSTNQDGAAIFFAAAMAATIFRWGR